MTTYLGVDVLERTANAREDIQSAFARVTALFDPGMGKPNTRAKDAAPTVDRNFLWTCTTKAEIAALKAWFDLRKGQLVPFWVSSWRQDLTLAQAATAIDTSILIRPSGYTLYAFPQHARRHLAIHFGDGSLAYRQVLGATDNGSSETISFSGALGNSLLNGAWVSYLTYCRLASDVLELSYITDSIAEAQLRFVEIPEEAP